MLLTIICLILLVSTAAQEVRRVTMGEEQQAREECRGLLDLNDNFIAGFVRLSFHDCIGGCDGCINLNNGENNGLKRYADVLDRDFESKEAYDWMSRADFWALCGTEAVIRGITNAGGTVPEMTFKFGRQNCANNPNNDDGYNDIGANRRFPSSSGGLSATLDYFQTNFELSDKETVALLGAHSLGRAQVPNSGYAGPWVRQTTHLDNAYYNDMRGVQWLQREVVNNADGSSKWQYSHRNGGALMLNADICLLKDIVPGENGRVEGDLTSFPDSTTRQYVEQYAGNNQLFLDDFAQVFTKVIEKGNEGGLTEAVEEELLEVVTTPLTFIEPTPPRRNNNRRPRPREENDQEDLIRMLARILADQK